VLASLLLHIWSRKTLSFGFTLGSAFFCKHDDINKNSAERIISTIAFNLASKLPQYRDFLLKEMEDDNNNVGKGETSILYKPAIAFDRLVIKGLQNIQLPSSQPHFVLIIDALDELGLQGDPVRKEFLNLIRYQIDKLPPWIRVFATSRPEMDIYQTLNVVNFSVLLPQDHNNIQDIQTFVQHQLSTQLSIDEGCNGEVLEQSNRLDGGLDQIYLQVLERAFNEADETTFERFRLVLGVVITAREPLHQDSIARLLGIKVADVGGVVLRVQSILTVSNGAIKVLHKSLKDFLSSSERCKNQHVFIDTTAFESIMATSCLRGMTEELKHNMANLPNDTDKFHASTNAIISPHVTYACKFWNSHVLASHNSLVLDSLSSFCNKSLLFWIEAMVLLQLLSNDVGSDLRRVGKWVADIIENESFSGTEQTGIYSLTRNLLEDAARLIWRFYTEMAYNPLQVYSVAEAFSPRGTDIYKTFHSHNDEYISFVGEMHWGPHLHYLHGHTAQITSFCFSNDGKKLLSGSEDKSVRLWNVATMKELVRFDGHSEGLFSACFSRNQQLVGSVSSRGNVILWDINSTQVVKTLTVSCGQVSSASFSPDLCLLALKRDTTIQIVDIMRDCSPMYLEGSESFSALRFSPCGGLIAAGSSDGLLEIWNARNGQKLTTLSEYWPYEITQV
ncbi:hypothetical protein HDU76_008253, partial [Blyttiomyces sp. JEL0837]